jgi:signal peptidase I
MRGPRRLGQWLGWGATLAVVAAWFLLFRPVGLGGPAAFVTVEGVSMVPTYHSGDLVITHKESSYRVGQVIAYRIPAGQVAAGHIVIHRIVGGNGTTGLIAQGDANSFTDMWHPKTADVIGTPYLLIPNGGRTLFFLRQPFVTATLAALLALWMVLGTNERKGRRPKSSSEDSENGPHQTQAF